MSAYPAKADMRTAEDDAMDWTGLAQDRVGDPGLLQEL